MRLVDTLNSAGFDLEYDDVRLWLSNADNLVEKCKLVADGFKKEPAEA